MILALNFDWAINVSNLVAITSTILGAAFYVGNIRSHFVEMLADIREIKEDLKTTIRDHGAVSKNLSVLEQRVSAAEQEIIRIRLNLHEVRNTVQELMRGT